jgi:hypothetical protein
MIGFLILFFHVLISPFKTQARLEAEIVLLRHQLGVLRAHVFEAEADGRRPTALRLALSIVSLVAERGDDQPTGDRHPVASNGLPTVSAMEVALAVGDPPPDPRDELGQSIVGCAPHSR